MFLGTCCSRPQIIVKYPDFNIYEPKSVVEETAYKSVVKLEKKIIIGGSVVSTASGFAIGKHRIMTAAHFCVDGTDNKTVDFVVSYINNNDNLVSQGGASVETADVKMDLCVLKLKNHGIKPLPLIKNYSNVKIHDSVFVVGGPLGYYPATSEGRVVDPKMKEHDDMLVVHVVGTFGNSGGPIIDENGHVVGVVVLKLANYDHILISVPATDIRSYFRDQYGKKKKKKKNGK